MSEASALPSDEDIKSLRDALWEALARREGDPLTRIATAVERNAAASTALARATERRHELDEVLIGLALVGALAWLAWRASTHLAAFLGDLR